MLNKVNFNPSFQGKIDVYTFKKIAGNRHQVIDVEDFITSSKDDLKLKRAFNKINSFKNFKPINIDKTEATQKLTDLIESIIGKKLNWNNSDKKILSKGNDKSLYYGDALINQNDGIHVCITFD